jgi:hypothetical protein
VHVRVTTLDASCEREAVGRVDFLKVESETGPLIAFEVGDALAAAFGSTAAETKRLLIKAGYGIYRCRQERLESVPPEAGHPTSEDLVAVRAAHLDSYPGLRRMVRG